ncbi:MAG: glutamate racemase [Rikenellaceae bacterium]
MSLTPSNKALVAAIDSGVGGLSVIAELRLILPHNSLIYFADSANCPYGAKSNNEIEKLTLNVAEKVIELGAQIVVVACNTMTASAIKSLRKRWPEVDFVGMEPAIKPAVSSSKKHIVGVLATQATLGGELYNHTKSSYAEGSQVIEVAGSGLVEFVEAQRYRSDECKTLVREYVEEFLDSGADKIVLGCTHYPFLIGAIQEVVAPVEKELGYKIEIINPAPAIAQRTKELAAARGILEREGAAEVHYYTSGGDRELEILKGFLENFGNRPLGL